MRNFSINSVITFLFLAWMCLVPAIAADPRPPDGSAGPDPPSAADFVPDPVPSASAPAAQTNDDPKKLKVAIHPLFGWLPYFSSSVNAPPLLGGSVGGGNLIANPNTSVNGAVAFALDVSFKKWLFEG